MIAPSRRGDGFGQMNPMPEAAASARAQELIREAHRCEFTRPLDTLNRHRSRLDAPLVAEVLQAVAVATAAEVRAKAEADLVERLEDDGQTDHRGPIERGRLRDEIAAAITLALEDKLRAGHEVGAERVRALARDRAGRVVADNAVARITN